LGRLSHIGTVCVNGHARLRTLGLCGYGIDDPQRFDEREERLGER
jgi:hypothetical protein